MAAGVTIDRGAFSDERITYLADLAGYNSHEALGRLARLWSVCTELQTSTPPLDRIRACLGPRGDQLLVAAGLGEPTSDGLVRVRGTGGRTEWFGELIVQQVNAGKARAATAIRDSKGRLQRLQPAGESVQRAGSSASSALVQRSSQSPARVQPSPAQEQEYDQGAFGRSDQVPDPDRARPLPEPPDSRSPATARSPGRRGYPPRAAVAPALSSGPEPGVGVAGVLRGQADAESIDNQEVGGASEYSTGVGAGIRMGPTLARTGVEPVAPTAVPSTVYRGSSRDRGAVVPHAPETASDRAVCDLPHRKLPSAPAPHPSASNASTGNPEAAERRRLIELFVLRCTEARVRVAARLRLDVPRAIGLMGEGEKALMDRLRESADPVGDLEHVLAIAEAEALATRELRWLSWSLAQPKAWALKLAATLSEARSPRVKAGEAPLLPSPESDAARRAEMRQQQQELAARDARAAADRDEVARMAAELARSLNGKPTDG